MALILQQIREITFTDEYVNYNGPQFPPGSNLQIYYDQSLDPDPQENSTGFSVILNGAPFTQSPTGPQFRLPDSNNPDEALMIIDSKFPMSFCNGDDLIEFILPDASFWPYAEKRITRNATECTIGVCDLISGIADVVKATGPTNPDGQVYVNVTTSHGPPQYNLGSDFEYGLGHEDNSFLNLLPGTYRIFVRDSKNCAINFLVEVGFDNTYSPKYRLIYDKIDGSAVTRVDLVSRSYSGDPIEVKGGDYPFKLALRAEAQQDKFLSIIRSEAVTILLSTFDGEYRDLSTQGPNEWQLYYYIDDVLLWAGRYVINQFQEQYKFHPYYIQFSFDDGVSQLKDLPFIADDNTNFQGTQRVINLIAYCLKKTGLSLPIRSGINVFSTEMDLGVGGFDDPLDKCFVDVERYYLISDTPTVFDVLQYILDSFNARLVQYGGYWNIFRPTEMVGDFEYRIFSADGGWDGVVDTLNLIQPVQKHTSARLVNADHNLETVPAYGRLRIIYNLGAKPNFFKNGDFSLYSVYNTTTGTYDFKINTIGFTITRPYPITLSYEQVDSSGNVALIMANSISADTSVDGSASIRTAPTTIHMGANDQIAVNIVVRPESAPSGGDGTLIGVPYTKIRFSVQYNIGVAAYLQSDGTWSSNPNVITNYVTEYGKYQSIVINAASPGPGAVNGGDLIVTLFHCTAMHHEFNSFSDLRAMNTVSVRMARRTEVVFDGASIGYTDGSFIAYYELEENTSTEHLPDNLKPHDYNATTNARQWVLKKITEYDFDYGRMAVDKISVSMKTYDTIIREAQGQNNNRAVLERTVYHGFSTSFFKTLPNTNKLYNTNTLVGINAVFFNEVFSGYFRDIFGTGFEHWYRKNIAESDSLHGILVSEMASQYKQSSGLIRGSIRTTGFPGLLVIFEIDDVKYLPMSFEYNDKYSIYENCELIELRDTFSDPGSDGSGEAPYSSGFTTGFGKKSFN